MTEEKLARTVRVAVLVDLYGELLTHGQLRMVKLYFDEDLSFGELAEEFQVSRQAVHETVRRAVESLEDYERKLGLMKRLESQRALLERLEAELAGVPLGPAADRLRAIMDEFREELS